MHDLSARNIRESTIFMLQSQGQLDNAVAKIRFFIALRWKCANKLFTTIVDSCIWIVNAHL